MLGFLRGIMVLMIMESPSHPHNDPARRQERHAQEHVKILLQHLHDSPLDLNQEQQELAETMVRRLIKDIRHGKHPVISELLNQPDRADEIAENLVSPISRFVKGMSVDNIHASASMLHHLNESDHFQQSAMETPAEEMLRKLQDKDESLANYFQLEEIEKKESKGELPKESAVSFMQRMKEAHASMRVPGVFERRQIDELVERIEHAADHLLHGGRTGPS